MENDMEVIVHGSIALLEPHSTRGAEWLRENTDAPSWAWLGHSLAVEPRMLDDIIQGATDDGLTVGGWE